MSKPHSEKIDWKGICTTLREIAIRKRALGLKRTAAMFKRWAQRMEK
jgi:hypothetical protein